MLSVLEALMTTGNGVYLYLPSQTLGQTDEGPLMNKTVLKFNCLRHKKKD